MERLREKRFMPLEDTCCISELIELRDVIRPDIGPETGEFKVFEYSKEFDFLK